MSKKPKIRQQRAVQNAGTVRFITTLDTENGKHGRETHKLLLGSLEELARQSRAFSEVVGELPFTYRERQLTGLLIPAFSKMAQAVFAEQPVDRNYHSTKDAGSGGWIDYWIRAKKRFVFLVEVKHAFANMSPALITGKSPADFDGASIGFTEDFRNKWQEVCAQIRSITAKEAKNFNANGDSRVVTVALQVVPIQTSSNDWKKLANEPKGNPKRFNSEKHRGLHLSKEAGDWLLKNAADQLITNANGLLAPNWIGLWSLHDKMQTLEEYWDDEYELFPAMLVIARAESPLKPEKLHPEVVEKKSPST